MPPAWLNVLATVVVLASLASAAIVGLDILAGRRQKMAIMNVGWPITALYLGPIGLGAYWVMERPQAGEGGDHGSHEHGGHGDRAKNPSWQTVFKATSHCGAGCTVGDAIGESAIFLLGTTLFGSKLGTAYLVDFVLAYAFGIVFQSFTIASMRGLGLGDGLKAAVKADSISLVAFEVGMFAFMALNRLVLFPSAPPEPNSMTYWFLMQIAMIVGFATSFPANRWLVKAGLKEAM
jgi:Domain of unknown function (DUF4396)